MTDHANMGELLAMALGVVTVLAGVVAALVRYLPRPRARSSTPPPKPPDLQALVVSAVDLGQLKEAVEMLASEVQRLRDWRHDVEPSIGAVRMVGAILRQVNDVRERVARLEGRRP